jgi:Na+:H+ antiporter, NhaA family
MKTRTKGSLAALAAASIVSWAVVLPAAGQEPPLPSIAQTPAAMVPVEGAPSRGPIDAPIVVVEFCDLASEACSAAAVVFDAVLEQYGDRVRHVFRHRPNPHMPDQHVAHEATVAAGAQGGFWIMREMVLNNQHALVREGLLGMAAQAGLDAARLAADLDSGEHRQGIDRDVADAESLEIKIVPTFFVNGHRVTGVPTRTEWVTWLEELLSGTSDR